MSKIKFQSLFGMHDILAEDQNYFNKVYKAIRDIAEFYNFQKIETPILEKTELFVKGIGTNTDIIEKEMYSFKTKGGDEVSLRPEGTPSIIRAYLEHGMFNLPQPVKLWYFGPFFRHERPQAGRFRQFHQFGLEVINAKDSVIDAQIIQICYNILKELKFKNLVIEINSIGDSQCRPYYKKLLTRFLRSKETILCSDCKRRLKKNSLRILDCKNEKCQEIISKAPQILNYLCEECHIHFKEVLEFLDELNLPYNMNPYLVRGLDYYTKTVFEIVEITENQTENQEKKKNDALIGGGRYDDLVKTLGGADTPACGGAGGIERIIEAMKINNIKFLNISTPKIFLTQLGNLAKRKSLKILEDFRKEKIPISECFSKDSLRNQLSRANKLGVEYVLIIGHKEALDETVIIRDMKKGEQKVIKIEKLIEEIKKKLKKI